MFVILFFQLSCKFEILQSETLESKITEWRLKKTESLATRADWPHTLAPSDPFSSSEAFLLVLMHLSYVEAPFLLPHRPPPAHVLPPHNGCALAVLLANSASSLDPEGQ